MSKVRFSRAILAAPAAVILGLGSACGGSGSIDAPTPPAATPANPTGWTGVQGLEASLALNSTYPSVAMDVHGDSFAVWQKAVSSTASAVWGNQFLDSTGAWGTDASFSSIAGSSQDVKVATDGNLTFLYAWDVTPDGTSYSVYVSSATVAGGLGTPLQLGPASSYSPSVAMNASGAACVAWMMDGPSFKQVWAAQYDPATLAWSAPVQISTTTTADALVPAVAMDAAGDTVIMWTEGIYTKGPYVDKLAAYVPATGWSAPSSPLAAGDQVDAYNGLPGPFALAMTSAGAVAAWSETADGGVTFTIRTTSWTAGAGWTAQTQVGPSGGYAILPALALDGQGDALLAWTTGGSEEYAPTNLLYATLPAAGAWQTPVALLSGVLGLNNPCLALNASGTGVLAFNQHDGFTWRVCAANIAPGAVFTAPLYLQTSTGGDADGPSAFTDAAGQSMVVWDQADQNDLTHIYGNFYN